MKQWGYHVVWKHDLTCMKIPKKKKKKNPQQKMQCLKAFSKEAITDRLICKK